MTLLSHKKIRGSFSRKGMKNVLPFTIFILTYYESILVLAGFLWVVAVGRHMAVAHGHKDLLCLLRLFSMPWICFWHLLDVIPLFKPSFVKVIHLTFVVDEIPIVGSSWNYAMLLCILLEDLSNLCIINLMCGSLRLNYVGLLTLPLTESWNFWSIYPKIIIECCSWRV